MSSKEEKKESFFEKYAIYLAGIVAIGILLLMFKPMLDRKNLRLKNHSKYPR
jgi:hypothetical protein